MAVPQSKSETARHHVASFLRISNSGQAREAVAAVYDTMARCRVILEEFCIPTSLLAAPPQGASRTGPAC